ncbi:MAG: hypothetical protein KGI38_12285 [Thaumarchaeota archaeon]|nr:hypothetical protein [Nitrososphaerota archaeon]
MNAASAGKGKMVVAHIVPIRGVWFIERCIFPDDPVHYEPEAAGLVKESDLD